MLAFWGIYQLFTLPKVSNAIAHIVKYKSGKPLVNYLDNFLFLALLREMCNKQVELFLELCDQIQFLVSLEKTFWASTSMTFLGFLIDTIQKLVSIPVEKIQKANDLITDILSHKKTTVCKLQKLCGFLNFLCHRIVLGRAFTRRLYFHYSPKMKPHHHLKVSEDI